MTDRRERQRLARLDIGRRCSWNDGEGSGRIVNVDITVNGYPRYVVEWDDPHPGWWGNLVSASHAGGLLKVERP